MAHKARLGAIVLILLYDASTCVLGMRLPAWPTLNCNGCQHSSGWASATKQHVLTSFQHATAQIMTNVGASDPNRASRAAASTLPPLAEAKAAFLAEHGRSYGYKGWLDAHWQQEVGVRLPGNQHYLDFTGSALYANSQLFAATKLLATDAFGNPHSRNPSSHRSAELEAAAAKQGLAWLSADPDEYAVVWTRSATEALKMVGEWFPWRPADDWQPSKGTPAGGVSDKTVGNVSKCGTKLHFKDPRHDHTSHFVYTRANHKSVLGIGAYAQDKGSLLSCVDAAEMNDWLNQAPHGAHVDPASKKHNHTATYSLVAFPAKDNYEGVLYPLEWVDKVHAKSTDHHRWMVMLDAAAYVPIHPLNLTQTKADLVSMSFYKVFGYPTGLGALVLRKASAVVLHKVYFGGGAVDDATAEDVWRLLSKVPDRFQDGTIDFLGIAQLQYGFQLLDTLGGMQAVHRHVSALQAYAYQQLSSLHHSSGRPLLQIFGKHDQPKQQSCLFQFLVHSPNGSVVPAEEVEVVAAAAGVHLRTGCHCNPGQCLLDLGIKPEEERAAALAHNTSGGFITVLRHTHGGKAERVKLPIGSVRASLGALSTFEDVYALLRFLSETYIDREDVSGLAGAASRAYRNITVHEYWNAHCGA